MGDNISGEVVFSTYSEYDHWRMRLPPELRHWLLYEASCSYPARTIFEYWEGEGWNTAETLELLRIADLLSLKQNAVEYTQTNIDYRAEKLGVVLKP